jgi:hypothetical protein
MKRLVYLFILFALLLFVSCKTDKTDPSSMLFELKENTGINFNNQVTDGSLENSFLFRNFYNGGGVALGDINNDGMPDVFLTSNAGANKLYLNKGDLNSTTFPTKQESYMIVCGAPVSSLPI